MKQLLLVGIGTLALAVLLAGLLRQDSDDSIEAPVVEIPVFKANVEINGDQMNPYQVSVPKDHEVHLLVHGAPNAVEGMLTIKGYEDIVDAEDIGPGLSREFVFLTSRPGDDFALALGDQILGRLEVTGSHLEEGHQ